ncbi:hypothetical protein [Prochlorococcus marinus]|uniref:hypothetical protein n=1 Tax=Prochlorococcus marinus TaxID=1219 RepID=UPI001ADAC843|nr:hypothetical protein [Prochlorococcus marinus]
MILIFFTYEIFPDKWRFGDHDILYFGWLNGIFSLDYSGPIRIPTAYPSIMSANHLTPGSLIIPFTIFSKVNIINSYKIKFALISLAFFYFIKTFNNTNLVLKVGISRINNLILNNSFLILLFIIFGSELQYNLSVSNWPIFILILLFSSLCMNQLNESEKLNSFEFLKYSFLFITLLTIAKAVTFPIFSLSIIFLFFNYKNTFRIKTILNISNLNIFLIIVSMIIISIIGWTIQDSNHGTLSAAFPLCLIDGLAQPEECITSLFKNPFERWVIPGNIFLIIQTIFSRDRFPGFQDFIYIWFFCILPCIISGYFLFKKSIIKELKFFASFTIFYGLATAFGVVIFRTSLGYDGMTTAHAYLIIPLFIISNLILIYLTSNFSNNLFKKIRLPILFLLVTALISYNYAWTPNKDAYISIKESTKEDLGSVSLTISEMNNFYKKDNSICTTDKKLITFFKEFLDLNNCNSSDIQHIFHSMKGIRSNAAFTHKNSLINEWIKDNN